MTEKAGAKSQTHARLNVCDFAPAFSVTAARFAGPVARAEAAASAYFSSCLRAFVPSWPKFFSWFRGFVVSWFRGSWFRGSWAVVSSVKRRYCVLVRIAGAFGFESAFAMSQLA